MFNCVIMLVAAILFGVKLAVFTLISMYITGVVTDSVVQGFNRRIIAIIVSDKAEALAKNIIAEVGRGVTFLHGEGAFTGDSKKVVFLAMTLTQVAKVKEILEDIDPVAFMIMHDAAEIAGRGFTLPMPNGTENLHPSAIKNALKTLLD